VPIPAVMTVARPARGDRDAVARRSVAARQQARRPAVHAAGREADRRVTACPGWASASGPRLDPWAARPCPAATGIRDGAHQERAVPTASRAARAPDQPDSALGWGGRWGRRSAAGIAAGGARSPPRAHRAGSGDSDAWPAVGLPRGHGRVERDVACGRGRRVTRPGRRWRRDTATCHRRPPHAHDPSVLRRRLTRFVVEPFEAAGISHRDDPGMPQSGTFGPF
jgi:hypothetical protein